MKVRYTIPVRGTLRLTSTDPIKYESWNFEFRVDGETGFVNALIIEVLNIPRDTLANVETGETGCIRCAAAIPVRCESERL
jgi:hypothetical protein